MTDVAGPVLEVAGLAKRFGSVVTARDVSFAVTAGEVLGVVGPNGAGKSTLLDMIAGTVVQDAGTIRLLGEDVSHTRAAARSSRGVGRSYQIPRPFTGMTVFENVLVGSRFAGGLRGGAAYDAAYDALRVTGLQDLANLTAGKLRLLDRKRLELARALATGPSLVLLDEIAGGLTDQELPELIDIIRALREQGLAVVWIEHIVHALTQVVDRLMCLALGDVVAIGHPDDVINHPRVVEVYLGTTVEVDAAS